MRKYLLIQFLILMFAAPAILAQDTLVRWTFPTGTGSDSLPDISLAMNAAFAIHASGGTSAINFSTNGNPTYCAQATGWDGGTNTKYWSIRFKSTAYINLKLSAQVRAGNTNAGPRDFKVQYRPYMAVTWTDVPGGNITTANNWTTGTVSNLSLPAALNNQSGFIELRFVMRTDTSIAGTLVQTAGISKIDNIMITGNLSTGISELDVEKETFIYPNPCNGSFSLVTTGDGNFDKLEVYNTSGQKMSEGAIFPGENHKSLVVNYPPGVYFLRLSGTEKVKILKIIIK